MSNPEVWKVLALSLAEAIKCVISNAHYDLRHGIGDVEQMLQAIQMQREADRSNHAARDTKPKPNETYEQNPY